ncbi:dihydropteroate synthase [Rhodococcus sp. 06-412-2C]|uniref:dihydropteroate synthase n=1 Tax=unclassified Rhodococcus (in: high G+C Gram-positive bacteria) TaxID=192944 RepID=UPI000B9BA9F9|nr:dihydropteroate synthase [Rhodococcus sp. 06-412-2C]OZC90236.1 dihydropteroate synthase [Rhodococcus sp. 06-412-2B]
MLTRLTTSHPVVCGIVNVTPDSFSDGGLFLDSDRAVAQALSMVDEGAELLDIGGESTRPGATPPTVEEEIARVVPVIDALSRRTSTPLSVDTSRPEVMREAVRAGASVINDVRALRLPGALGAAAELGAAVCLTHMQGEPSTMQHSPRYGDVTAEVCKFLEDRAAECIRAGIPPYRILIDPGFGFGKTLEHNLHLLHGLRALTASGRPIMAGVSRKGMIGAITGREVDDRLAGSLTAAILAAQNGVSLLRVHDVAATIDALAVMRALRSLDSIPGQSTKNAEATS